MARSNSCSPDTAGTGTNHHADFCFDVEEEGVYRLEGRFLAENNDKDSFYVTINGMPVTGYLWDMPTATEWQTDYVIDRDNGNAIVEVSLATGSNLVQIYHREPDTRLDWLRLEKHLLLVLMLYSYLVEQLIKFETTLLIHHLLEKRALT